MWLIALCMSGIPARSHLKLISVQHLTLSALLKIDAAVITRISSHHDNSLCLGCYRNLRFILLWLQKHRTGGKEEKKTQIFKKKNILPVPLYLLLRGKKGLGREVKKNQVKHVKTWEENRGGEIQSMAENWQRHCFVLFFVSPQGSHWCQATGIIRENSSIIAGN